MREWGERSKTCPVVIVPTKYYSTPTQAFRDANVSVCIWANHQMRMAVTAMQAITKQIFEEQTLINVEDKIVPVSELFRLQNDKELEAAEKLNATVANMRFVKPLDTELIQFLAAEHTLIVTIEENTVMGGAGAAVMEALQALNLDKPTLCLGLPDNFIEHGIHETMLAECGLDVVGIVAAIEKKLT